MGPNRSASSGENAPFLMQEMASARRGDCAAASRPVETGLPPLLDLGRGQSEDKDVLRAHLVANLDVGAIERADG